LLWEDEPDLVEKLGRLLIGPLPARAEIRAAAHRFAWETVGPEWERVLERVSHGDFATKASGSPY
jgi:hypothetical protein